MWRRVHSKEVIMVICIRYGHWNVNLPFFRLSKQWCSNAFKNVNVVPPDVGAVHQVNLEHLSRVVQVTDGFIYPDSVVGTDSHTTMVNGLGILGWGEPFFFSEFTPSCWFSAGSQFHNCVSARCGGHRVRSCDVGPAGFPGPSSGGGL